MNTRWPKTTHLKIHQHCGGMVRWVEAYDDPHVGFTGQCLECGEEGIVVEDILPFELPDGMTCCEAYNQADLEDLRSFLWEPNPDNYDAKQQEFRELIDA